MKLYTLLKTQDPENRTLLIWAVGARLGQIKECTPRDYPVATFLVPFTGNGTEIDFGSFWLFVTWADEVEVTKKIPFFTRCSFIIVNVSKRRKRMSQHSLNENYTCQLSRLRVENFDLTPAHAWLKNVSCCRLTWHSFQKYVNSDPCKERKPCVN